MYRIKIIWFLFRTRLAQLLLVFLTWLRTSRAPHQLKVWANRTLYNAVTRGITSRRARHHAWFLFNHHKALKRYGYLYTDGGSRFKKRKERAKPHAAHWKR